MSHIPKVLRVWRRERPPPPCRSYFSRSGGLELPLLWDCYGTRHGEQPKLVVKQSRAVATWRCCVHVLPVLVSIAIIAINLRHEYLGRSIPGLIESMSVNMALLQIAAKTQELLVVASMATVVLGAIRQEMLFGDGVPLGLIGGGYLFSSGRYFISPEFWGSLSAKLSAPARFRLYGLLVICGIIAAFVGPACAVLLIPRQQDRMAGGASIYLVGSEGRQPSILDFSQSGIEPFCNSANATSYAVCPSGGYMSILSSPSSSMIFGQSAYEPGTGDSNFIDTAFGTKLPLLVNNYPLLPNWRFTGNWRGYACETSLTGVRAIETMFHTQLLVDWLQQADSFSYNPLHPSRSEYKWWSSLFATTPLAEIPAARVTCSRAQNISRLNYWVSFPVLPEGGCSSRTQGFYMSQLNQTPVNHVRTTWVKLPPLFGTISAGLTVEAPWTAGDNSRVVLGCSIDSRWTNGSIASGSSEIPLFPIIDYMTPSQTVATSGVFLQVPTLAGSSNYSEFRPILMGNSRRIDLDQSWLEILTPRAPPSSQWGPNEQNLNTLETALYPLVYTLSSSSLTQTDLWNTEESSKVNRTVALEWLVSLFIVDGLSREGTTRFLNTTGDVSSWSILDYQKRPDFQSRLFNNQEPLEKPNATDFHEEEVHIMINGYVYQAASVTDYLSIAVLLLYIAIVLCHSVCLIWKGQSSEAWNTITELATLLQNSRPAAVALKNTSAGIKELKTYSKIGIIRAVKQANHDANDLSNVEIIFHDEGMESVELAHLSTTSATKVATWPLIPKPVVQEASSSGSSAVQSKFDDGFGWIAERVQPETEYGHHE